MVFDVWSIVIMVILLIGLLIGVRGFAKQVKFLFGFFGAIIVAILLYKLVYLLLSKTGLEANLSDMFTAKFAEKGGAFNETVTEATFSDVIKGLLESVKIPTFISNLVVSKFPYDASYEGLTYATVVGMSLGKLLTNAIAFVAIFIVAWIVLAIVYKLIKGFFNIELMKPLDIVLGMALGLLKAAILICAIVWVLSLLQAKSGVIGETIQKILPKEPEDGFSLGYWVYQNNPFAYLIGKLF